MDNITLECLFRYLGTHSLALTKMTELKLKAVMLLVAID